ncbi:MAG: histidine kinase [Deferrisomatales bacterium]|nr:histidine kinase [Deferrisomatales bacterium]
MKSEGVRPDGFTALRRRAEARARKGAAQPPENVAALSPEEARRTLHELRVHQIELEMQNEELRRTQAELELARARYFDLYDRAPVAYCTLTEWGIIREVNLTAATLLGVTAGALVGQPITRFILGEDQGSFVDLRERLFATGDPQECELRMLSRAGDAFWAHLGATAARDAEGALACRVVLSDVSGRKKGEEALLRSLDELRQVSALLLAAQEEERGRFSRELHDGVCQTMIAMKMTLEAALGTQGPAPERLAAIDLLVPMMRDAIQEVRGVFMALRPAILDDLGLVAAIRWFARELQTAYPAMRIVLRIEVDEQDVPNPLRTVIFRVLQEAMTNAGKHSGADEAVVSLAKSGGLLEFGVEDNGRGFDADAPRVGEGAQCGAGLGCMRVRVERAGGSLEVQARKGEGTAIRARLPLAAGCAA